MKKLSSLFLMLMLTVTAWAANVTGTINFGSASGSTKISATSVTGDDDLGNTWTITTVMNQTSFTQNASYSQVGSSNKPATSITLTTTLPSSVEVTAFSAKFGGFSGTAGDISLKVGDTEVGSGSLNATSDVTVSSTSSETGTVLTVTVTNISKGVKVYYVSYTYSDGGEVQPSVAPEGAFTFDPGDGSTVNIGSTVAIAFNGEASGIKYTTDGNDPDEDSADYSGPIALSGDAGDQVTVKAIAYNTNGTDFAATAVASATYTLQQSTGGTVTFVAGTDTGSGTGTGVESSITKEGVTIHFTSARNNDAPYRIYSGSTTTVSVGSDYRITEIVITRNGSYSPSLLSLAADQPGSYSTGETTGTWTGSAVSVAFSASAQFRADEIAVTYELYDPDQPVAPDAPVVTLTQNAQDNTKLDVAITCENAEGIVFTFDGDDPTLNSPNFVDGYQIDLTLVPSPITVKAVGYDAAHNLGEIGSASFTLAPIEITFDPVDGTEYSTEQLDVTVTVANAIGEPVITYYYDNAEVEPVEGVIYVNGTATISVEVLDERAGAEVVEASATYTYVDTPTPTSYEWVLTDFADLADDDIVVFARTSGTTVAMSNNNGASSAPSAVAVTIAGDKITSEVGEEIQWIVGKNNTDITLYKDGNTWLYGLTSGNNGLRVGTNENNNAFTLSSDDYLYCTDAGRYVGVYNDQDWRWYTSNTGNSNIANQEFGFFKKTAASPVTGIGTPVVTLTQNAQDNTKLDVAITCENAEGIIFSLDGSDPTEMGDVIDYEEGYQIDLTQVPSPVTVKAAGYTGVFDEFGAVGTASFTLAPIEITIDPASTWFTDTQDVTVTVSGTIGVPVVEYKVNDELVENATGEFTFTTTSVLEVSVLDDRADGEVVTATETYTKQIGLIGTIRFGSGEAKTPINAHEVIDEDDLGNEWTITTDGTTSYTQNSDYSQVGSSNNPAQSITFTMTLPNVAKVNHFEAMFGGFNGTAGDVSLTVDGTEVGSGALIPSDNVIVGASQEAIGRVLTITVNNIAKGVKVYYIEYGYETIETETLADALAGEEGDVALSEPLKIVRVADGLAYASNGEDWVTLSGLDDPAEGEYVKNVVGLIGDLNTLPFIYVESYAIDEDASFDVPITRYNNMGDMSDFVEPKLAQVLIVEGYVIDGCLRAYSNGTGHSLKLEGGDIFDEGAYVAAEVSIKKDAVNVSGAPRRMDDTGNIFGGYTGVVVGSDTPTAVDTVKAGQAVVSVRYFNVAGMESSKPFNGVNVVVTKFADGTVKTAKVVR